MSTLQADTNMAIANTILAQLGGARFTTMTGAKHYLAVERGLRMRVPASLTKGRISLVTITLDSDDTYTMRCDRMIRRKEMGLSIPDVALVVERSCLYAEDLQSTFTGFTGLDTHL